MLIYHHLRECQLTHFQQHKQACGKRQNTRIPLHPTFKHSKALSNQLECLSSLDSACDDDNNVNRRISYLYYSSSPITTRPPPDPIPIVLCNSSSNLFQHLHEQANKTRNSTSINLMFSILSQVVTNRTLVKGGTEQRLIQQLSEEYEIDLNQMLIEETEPTESELLEAIGGSQSLPDLCGNWQKQTAVDNVII
ncbi:hypothetical protein OIO90_005198 [Microbotryomycetes sp. JL221]|nr:hypothetical protein OIO90_005198 [Microbotryomycetes sp. JL221]